MSNPELRERVIKYSDEKIIDAGRRLGTPRYRVIYSASHNTRQNESNDTQDTLAITPIKPHRIRVADVIVAGYAGTYIGTSLASGDYRDAAIGGGAYVVYTLARVLPTVISLKRRSRELDTHSRNLRR